MHDSILSGQGVKVGKCAIPACERMGTMAHGTHSDTWYCKVHFFEPNAPAQTRPVRSQLPPAVSAILASTQDGKKKRELWLYYHQLKDLGQEEYFYKTIGAKDVFK